MIRFAGFGLVSIAVATACGGDSEDSRGPRALRAVVETMYPHARDAFTEGLVYEDGCLYESTGLEGSSSLRRVDLTTGSVTLSRALSEGLFGEGLASVGTQLIQLTYDSGRALVYERDSFEPVGEFTYDGQGWGLCHDGTRMIMSDGTSTLQLRDPRTFELLDRVQVVDQGEPVEGLNELECFDGQVYANVFRTRRIARIDTATGILNAWIDTRGILFTDGVGDISGIDFLNGIAFVPERERFLITGKYWPRVFEVRFEPDTR